MPQKTYSMVKFSSLEKSTLMILSDILQFLNILKEQKSKLRMWELFQ